MSEEGERTGLIRMFGAIAGLFLGIFLLFLGFFTVYVNEMSTDVTQLEKMEKDEKLFDGIVFGDYSRMATNYKKDFLHEVHNGHTITTWVFRFLGVFFIWLGLTLIFIPIFTRYARDTLALYSLYTALALVAIFVLGLNLYTFILGGGLAFIGDFFKSIWGNIVSMFDLNFSLPFGTQFWSIFFFFLLLCFILYYFLVVRKNEDKHEKRVGAFKVYNPDKKE